MLSSLHACIDEGANVIGVNIEPQTTYREREKCYGHKLLGEKWINGKVIGG